MKKNILNIILVLCVVGLLASGVGLFMIYQRYHQAETEYTEIKETYTQEVVVETEEKEETVREIDFESLKEINEDIIGWIWLEDTEIDYPVLQSHDNDEYLHMTFNGTENSAGSLFVDARCNGMLSDDNTIIHGHNMKNGSMFHALNQYTDEDFYNQHRIFWIYTPEKSARYKIISVYIGDADSVSYYVEGMDMTYEEWLETVYGMSMYETDGYDAEKKTITLSTCHGSAGTSRRMIVHLQEI